MNKSLLKRIASVATELDMKGFTKEAKTVDLMLLKLAQEEYENVYQGYFDNKDFGKEEIGKEDTNNFKKLTDFLDEFGVEYAIYSTVVRVEGDLWLDNNNLTSLPESFGYLAIGGSLYLNGNNLTSLPESFGNLKIRKSLWLDNNNLTSLPESFGNLEINGSLYLYNNKLTSLPESFGNLKIGGDLWLHNNNLTSLPESLDNLKIGGRLSLGKQSNPL